MQSCAGDRLMTLRLQIAETVSAACNRAINALAIGLVLQMTSFHDNSKTGQASPASMLFAAGAARLQAHEAG